MKNSKNIDHIKERLADRRDYRQALINRRNETDVKISKVESEIRDLKESAK